MTFTAFVSFLMGPMLALTGIGAQLTEAMAGLDRTRELLREKREDQNPHRVEAMEPIQGLVSFEHVKFSYKEGNPVLHDVTFESRPGSVTSPHAARRRTAGHLPIRRDDPPECCIRACRCDGRGNHASM